jgi:hypothetical protein
LVTSIEYKSPYKAYFIFWNYFANTCSFVRWKALIFFIYVLFSVRPSRPSKQTGFGFFFGRGMLYSDMAWSRSSDIYIGDIYLHMVFVFYFISTETVPFRYHFVLYIWYICLSIGKPRVSPLLSRYGISRSCDEWSVSLPFSIVTTRPFSIQSCRSCYAYTTSRAVNAHFTRFL